MKLEQRVAERYTILSKRLIPRHLRITESIIDYVTQL